MSPSLPSSTTLDAVFRDYVRSLLRELLAEARDGASDCYSSISLPPRTKRRQFAKQRRSGRVEGAYREGRDWVCSRETWHAARRRTHKAAPSAPTFEPSVAERADRLLARAGLRVVGGGASR